MLFETTFRRALRTLALICTLLISFTPSLAGAAPGEWNDMGIYPKPPAPVLPPAGGSYTDPTFGTTIVRVTDENDGVTGQALYSYLSPFNLDSSLFVVQLTLQKPWGQTIIPYLYTFDPATATFAKQGPLWADHLYLQPGIVWSGTNPRLLFSLDTTQLYQFDVLTKTYLLLKDFAALCPVAGCNGWQLSKSTQDRYFAFHVLDQTQGYQAVKAVVWDKELDRTYEMPLSPHFTLFDETHLDRSGRWLLVKGKPNSLLWEFAADTLTQMPFVGHYDVGNGTVTGVGVLGPDAPGHRTFRLDDLGASVDAFYYPKKAGRQNWQTADHISIMASDLSQAFLGTYGGNRLSSFTSHSGQRYQQTGVGGALAAIAFPADVLRHNGRDLVQVQTLPTQPGQWFADLVNQTYVVWLYDSADPRDLTQWVTVFEWFPAMDEIVQISTDGSQRFRRLAHHRSGVWDYWSSARGSIDPSGRFFIYTSNWDGKTNPDGSPRTDVFLLLVPPVVSPPPPVVIPDTTPPSVTIDSPRRGRAVYEVVHATVASADNVAVTKLECYFDGALIAVFSPPSATVSWDILPSKKGRHLLTVKAFDAVGNAKEAKVSFIFKLLPVH